MLLGYYLLLLGFSLNGLIWLGIRRERQQLINDYKASIRQHQVVSISRRR